MLSTYHLGMIKKITPIKNDDFRGGLLRFPCFFPINIHKSPADTLLWGWDARLQSDLAWKSHGDYPLVI